jgi:exodeoxyribonuclease V alpha subunit
VGDADQLPSVGPGQVLTDLIDSRVVPWVSLQTIFRQRAGSTIATVSRSIRNGVLPEIPPPGGGGNLWFLEAADEQIETLVINWLRRDIPALLGVSPDSVQVLAAQTGGIAGVDRLNRKLRDVLNPAVRGRREWFRGTLALREGDKVIQTANNYRFNVFNGETGVVRGIDPVEQRVTVDFGDRVVIYTPADFPDLQHAYALTVHRSQGSEWPVVVVVVPTDHARMFTRRLLYTAITRGRQHTIIIGNRETLKRAVQNIQDSRRRTGLAARLQLAATGGDVLEG